MTPYRNLNGDSGVVSYEIAEDSIHVVFRAGVHRNYVYDHVRPGRAMVDRMKALAIQGRGLNAYTNATVRNSYAQRW